MLRFVVAARRGQPYLLATGWLRRRYVPSVVAALWEEMAASTSRVLSLNNGEVRVLQLRRPRHGSVNRLLPARHGVCGRWWWAAARPRRLPPAVMAQ